ncbi:MAG: hypothetical protein ACKOSQ_09030 [Planctomycetaceae bacterium]
MAADRAKTTLMIALIIFVMIAFILSVTTYLGFQQKEKESLAAKSFQADMQKANQDRDQAQDEARRFREVLGTDKDTADAVEAERNELFDRKFSAFDKDPKSLLRLVEWLADAIETKNADIKTLEAEKVQIRKEADDKVAQAQGLQKAAEKARDDAVAERDRLKGDFDSRWKEHEQAQRDMKAKQDVALGESERMKSITEELGKLGPLLSPDRRQKFARVADEGQPEPWPERVRFVNAELRAREQAIKDLNATLAKLRVADPKLQELVRDATPDDDRIDGFDGRVSAINAVDRTVLIVCDSTAGMRPGLRMAVYGPEDPRPRNAARKGMVEVVTVEGPTLARARIRADSTTAPILPGDGVATSLWAPGASPEIVIVGYVRFGADRKQDAAALTTAVARSGARVVDAVTPTTALVVDAGAPSSTDLAAGLGKDWKPADEGVRRRALERAKESGLRVVPLDGLLDMLGLDRESLDGRRLPWPVGAAP